MTLKRTFWKRLLGYLLKRGGVTDTCSLVCHPLLSTLVFPLRINSFLFDILYERLVLFFFITTSQNECLITAVTRLRDGMTGHRMTHRSSRQTVTRPLGTVVPFRTELQKHAMSTLCGCNKISGRLSREYEPRGKEIYSCPELKIYTEHVHFGRIYQVSFLMMRM